jgi:hypothetical protein
MKNEEVAVSDGDWELVRQGLRWAEDAGRTGVAEFAEAIAALARLEAQAEGHAGCERAHTERARQLKARAEAAEAERDALRAEVERLQNEAIHRAMGES